MPFAYNNISTHEEMMDNTNIDCNSSPDHEYMGEESLQQTVEKVQRRVEGLEEGNKHLAKAIEELLAEFHQQQIVIKSQTLRVNQLEERLVLLERELGNSQTYGQHMATLAEGLVEEISLVEDHCQNLQNANEQLVTEIETAHQMITKLGVTVTVSHKVATPDLPVQQDNQADDVNS
ncbi:MAG: hypothetical protein NVSMB70_18750 [Chamaesiphon sp.]